MMSDHSVILKKMKNKKSAIICLLMGFISFVIMMFTHMGQAMLANLCLGFAILFPIIAIVLQIKSKEKKSKIILIVAGLILLLIVLAMALPAISF
jgi:uncharacterized membrane protein HdeD (DUF308 family)